MSRKLWAFTVKGEDGDEELLIDPREIAAAARRPGGDVIVMLRGNHNTLTFKGGLSDASWAALRKAMQG